MSNPIEEYRSRLRDALGIINDLKVRIQTTERSRTESIAIVGIGCRFPGGGNGADAFFESLLHGVDAVHEIPDSRWPASAIPGERQDVRWAALLEDVGGFDATFFGISPREAASLDPQQRLLLEVAWEAIEDAGQLPEKLMGSRTGVMIGLAILDYQQRIISAGMDAVDTYSFTGNLGSTAAGRLSYFLGAQGPCVTIDTACSSSLVAIHLACQSLRSKECDLALAGGTNAIVSPFTMAMLSSTNALAPDGRCKTLDARANGYVRGEGCGILVLKRITDAKRDGDRIWALIRGSAVNQDGRSTGLTTPNVLSQQALLRQALENARTTAAQMGYIELHGTGTPLGDPIELEALKAVLGDVRVDGSTCVLGALKTNVGHLEGAAGVAGVIKAAVALRKEIVPANLHFRALNPRIELEDTPFVVPTENIPWPRGAQPRFAGVSSFGISGTNSHVILEEASSEEAKSAPVASAYILPLSAKSREALIAQAKLYSQWLSEPNDMSLPDIIYTASVRRTHHEHRLSVTFSTREEAASLLSAYARGEAPGGVSHGKAATQDRPKVLYVFSGQGSQWAEMGRRLLGEQPAFRAKLEEIDIQLRKYVPFSLLEELSRPEHESRLGETEVAQPAIFGLQVALFELLKCWGITPDAVVGHSVGEIAAAHVCGAFSLPEAARLVALRGKIMQRATGYGKMVWVSLPRAEAEKAIVGRERALAIAAVNDPASVVLSGESAALDALIAELSARGVVSRPLRVNYAFHSPQMEPLARELQTLLGRLEITPGSIAMYSTVTGRRAEARELDAAYWSRNVRGTVDFAAAVRLAIQDGHSLLVEVGPHPVLLANLQSIIAAVKGAARCIPTLRRKGEDLRSILETVGSLHVEGVGIAWKNLFPGGGRVATLPAYPWQRERYWIEPAVQTTRRGSFPKSEDAHPLLGAKVDFALAPETHIWEQWLSAEAFSFLGDHRVQGKVVFPGTGYVEMAVSAAIRLFGDRAFVVEELVLERMMVFEPGVERQTQVILVDNEDGTAIVTIASRDEADKQWTRHVRGKLRAETRAVGMQSGAISSETATPGDVVQSKEHYAQMAARGLGYGPAFQGVLDVSYGQGKAIGHVRLPEALAPIGSEYRMHPALLDACLQVASWALISANLGPGTFIPVRFVRFRSFAKMTGDVWVHVHARTQKDAVLPFVELSVRDKEGHVLLEIAELHVAEAPAPRGSAKEPCDEWLFETVWRRQELVEAASRSANGAWLIVSDRQGLGRETAMRLREKALICIEVESGTQFERLAENQYRLDTTDPAHIRRLMSECFGRQLVCRGVVHTIGLDTRPLEQTNADVFLADIRQSCVAALRLTQVLVTLGSRDTPRLYLVSRGAQAITLDAPLSGATQALLWGLGRTIAMEHPSLECVRVDLPSTSFSSETELLVHELLSNAEDDQIALRAEGRFVARLVRTSVGAVDVRAFSFREDASYLITGGLGGLGIELARDLARRGASHLVLVGRNEPTDQAAAAIREMERTGASVRTIRADVALRVDVERVLGFIHREMPPLAGIFHAAAVLDDHTLLEMSEESFLRVMGSKVLGAFHLHQLTLESQLDFFILYSSAAGTIGSPGQANYAAANAFVDALAQTRVASGLTAMSVAWGPFTDVGLAAAQESRGQRLAGRGMDGMSPSEGYSVLERLMTHPRANIVVIKLKLQQWQEYYPQAAGLPFFTELRREGSQMVRTEAANSFRVLLENAAPHERAALMQQYAREQLGRVLRIEPSKIDQTATLSSLGIDSLMSLEFKNRLQQSLGIELASTLLFTYPTLEKLASFLLHELSLSQGSAPSQASEETRTTSDQTPQAGSMDEMGVEDLMALLDEELALR